VALLVTVIVPVVATVLGGFGFNAGVIAEATAAAIASWPVSATA
jgi:hypothetical protein